jgi:hypothetical protein
VALYCKALGKSFFLRKTARLRSSVQRSACSALDSERRRVVRWLSYLQTLSDARKMQKTDEIEGMNAFCLCEKT